VALKPLVLIGLILVGIGLAGLVYGRFNYSTDRKVVDLGPIQASVSENHTVQIPDIAGIVAVVAGVIMIGLGMRRS
jgi:uncharacterized membrane protein YidH (DUF202 family)